MLNNIRFCLILLKCFILNITDTNRYHVLYWCSIYFLAGQQLFFQYVEAGQDFFFIINISGAKRFFKIINCCLPAPPSDKYCTVPNGNIYCFYSMHRYTHIFKAYHVILNYVTFTTEWLSYGVSQTRSGFPYKYCCMKCGSQIPLV